MKKKRENKRAFVYSIFIRYLILLISSLGNLWIFYFIFTPLTVYVVYLLLSLSFDTILIGNTIVLSNVSSPIEIIDACVAGAAYFLLLILNLSVPNIKIGKRVKLILFAFACFFVFNVLRITVLSLIFVSKPGLFDITHKLSWYLGSVVLVVAIWFVEVKIFKIKEIPFYSDIKSIFKYTK